MRLFLPAALRRPPTGKTVVASYSRFVALMKVALPATAVALLVLIVAWPKLAPQDEAFHLAFANFNAKSIDSLSMTNPRYFGTDDKNSPFTVTAEVGTQVDAQAMVVALEKPVADLSRRDGAGVVISADRGFFHQHENVLDLVGHVDLFHDNGYELHTSKARIELGPGNASGDEPARSEGPSGVVVGQGFRLWDRGKTVLFTGRARAILTMATKK